MPNVRNNRRLIMRRRVGSGSVLDTDYLAWRSAVGSVGATQETATNALIVSLKAHSLWTTLDRLWLLAAENSTQALTDVKNLGVATNSGSSFTASQGYTGNGSSTFINTNFAGTSGVNYTQNSAQISAYVRTNRTSAADKAAVSFSDPVSTGRSSRFEPYSTGAVIICPVNADGYDQFANPVSTAQGMWTASRTGSTTTNVYRNSSSSTLSTESVASNALNGTTFYIGANNNTAGTDRFSDDQIAIVAFGAGLSGADAAQFQTDVNTYMTALGTNVY